MVIAQNRPKRLTEFGRFPELPHIFIYIHPLPAVMLIRGPLYSAVVNTLLLESDWSLKVSIGVIPRTLDTLCD
jgi:hypothetical protein